MVEATRISPDEADTAEEKLDAAYAEAVSSDEVLAAHVDAAFPAEQPSIPVQNGHEAIASAIQAFVESSMVAVMLSSVPGKTREQNRAHEREEFAVKEFLRHWDSGGQEAFVRLLDHPDPAVRVAAACYLAGSDPDRAMPVLNELDKAGGPVGVSAHMMLFVMKSSHFSDPLIRPRADL